MVQKAIMRLMFPSLETGREYPIFAPNLEILDDLHDIMSTLLHHHGSLFSNT